MLLFYAGWPNEWASFNMTKEVYADDQCKAVHDGFFGMGEPTAEQYDDL